MNILFDFEELDKEGDIWKELPSEAVESFVAVKNFYKEQFAPIKDEIEAEETSKKCCVVIHYLKDPIKTELRGYSKKLKERMDGCISKKDFEYLNTLLLRLHQSRLN